MQHLGLKKLGCSKVISNANNNFWMIFPSTYPNAQCITLIIDPASNAYGSPFLICCCCWFLSWVMFKNNAKRKFLWAQKVFLNTHILSPSQPGLIPTPSWGVFYVLFFKVYYTMVAVIRAPFQNTFGVIICWWY